MPNRRFPAMNNTPDTGCEVEPKCLSCSLERCVLDLSADTRKWYIARYKAIKAEVPA